MQINKLMRFLPVIGIILFIYILYTNNITKIFSSLKQIDFFYLALSLSIIIPRALIYSSKWDYVLRKQNIRLPFGFVIKAYLISTFYGAITPGWLGTYIRIPYVMKKAKISLGKATSNLVIDTLIDLIAVFILVLIGSAVFFSKIPNLSPIIFAIFLVIISLIAYFSNKRRAEKFFKIILRFLIPSRYKEEVTRQFDIFYKSIPRFRSLMPPLLISLICILLAYTQIYLIARGLGINLDYIYFILIYPIAFLVELIPISISGLGTRELTLTTILSYLSIPPDRAILLSLTGYFVTVAIPAAAGALLAFKTLKGRSLEEMFSI